ncbi:MAG: hypothetical protein QGD94_08615, partial [Planctomycetia bacterium]|nr:hypothetical protein [Planctomycetia bacterium]
MREAGVDELKPRCYPSCRRTSLVPKLRLINPRNPLNALVDSDIARRVTFGRKAVFMPLGLMVAAGVVPRHWDVEIIDESTRGTPVVAPGHNGAPGTSSSAEFIRRHCLPKPSST